jgi:squalene synthase HpnC
MSSAGELASGKGHNDENFPVASFLIQPRLRPVVLAFYRFARTADDVADNAEAAPRQKLDLLESMRASLVGETNTDKDSVALRNALAERRLDKRHALDLLEAFRRDVTKLRYDSWDDLMDYCRYSAMPVGRFVLDVHGEDRALWPLNDALCAALQVINHLQDCAKDYKALDRVYLPTAFLVRAGVELDALKAAASSENLLKVIRELAQMTASLLAQSRSFADSIKDKRLGFEVEVIQTLAEDLNLRLLSSDPLRDRVHHNKVEVAGLAGRAALRFFTGRFRSKTPMQSAARNP